MGQSVNTTTVEDRRNSENTTEIVVLLEDHHDLECTLHQSHTFVNILRFDDELLKVSGELWENQNKAP